MLLAEGFEEAFLGPGYRASSEDIAIYNYDACASILVSRDGMSLEEAYEYLDFNVVGSYVGELTPIFLRIQGYEETLEQYKDTESRS
tara:strand:- start:315 stop:575 length:261 start_codon:yes stop_codon:yes gene_type:complete